MYTDNEAYDLPLLDGIPDLDGGAHRLVSGSEPAGVVDGNHRPAGDHPGESNVAGSGGADLCRRARRKVDTPMARKPWLRRRGIPANHGSRRHGKLEFFAAHE